MKRKDMIQQAGIMKKNSIAGRAGMTGQKCLALHGRADIINRAAKQVLCLVLMVCFLAAGLDAGRVKTQARAIDVTDSAAVRKIYILADELSTPCGYDLTYGMKVGDKRTYDFSQESVRRHVLSLDMAAYENQKNMGIDAETSSMRLFGEGTSDVDFQAGDWGVAWPQIKIKKIYRMSSAKYKVKADVQWRWEAAVSKNGKPGSRKIGGLTMILKKNPKYYYGFAIKSMSMAKKSESAVDG